MRTTRQGVRDLDQPARNGKRSGPPPCFHDMRHVSDCSTCEANYFGGVYGVAAFARCEFACRKCGHRRLL